MSCPKCGNIFYVDKKYYDNKMNYKCNNCGYEWEISDRAEMIATILTIIISIIIFVLIYY